MGNVYQKLAAMCTGSNPVLATVTGSSGSTPQKPGSSAIFDRSGLLYGTVGGGLTEGRVTDYAMNCVKTGVSAHLTFFLDNKVSDKDEAICGGEITVLVDAKPMNYLSLFREIDISMRKRIPGVLITIVTRFNDSQVLINRYWATSGDQSPEPFRNQLMPEVARMLSEGKPGDYGDISVRVDGEEPLALAFLELLLPQPHLVIAGAGHIGRALSHLGSLLDFHVTVIDSRPEYANERNLPDAGTILTGNIGEVLMDIEKNSDTYIVIVTRGHSDDAEALRSCIGTNAAYVGMIGSRPKIAKMRKDFIDKGWASKEQWEEIFTPIGLEINSKTVQEIAVSIAAQLVRQRNSRNV